MATAKKKPPATNPAGSAKTRVKTTKTGRVAQKTGKNGVRTAVEAAPREPAPVLSELATGKAGALVKRRRADWQAIERDYRLGKFTLRELEAKHGADDGLIARKAKKEGWKQDLSNAVKIATNAKLMEEAVKAEVSKGQQEVSTVVLAVAEVNKQVILAHRQDILRARQLTNTMLNELQEVTVNPRKLQDLLEVLVGGDEMTQAQIADARAAFADLSKLPTRIMSVQRLSQAMARLQTLERTAFGLDEREQPPPVDELGDLSDEELDASIRARFERLEQSRKS